MYTLHQIRQIANFIKSRQITFGKEDAVGTVHVTGRIQFPKMFENIMYG